MSGNGNSYNTRLFWNFGFVVVVVVFRGLMLLCLCFLLRQVQWILQGRLVASHAQCHFGLHG